MPNAPSPEKPDRLTYRQSGVDIAAGDEFVKAIAPFTASTRRAGAMADIGGFAGLFDLKAAGFSDPILVAATDGVGTKLKLATAVGRHDTVGIDLVAMCVNDIVVQGAEPLFFLDYFATGHLKAEIGAQVVGGIAEGCRQAGCALIGGETAEMPGMYGTGDYDLAGFSVGAAERGQLLPRDDFADGDVLIALASGGVHANGFSLVRSVVERGGHDLTAPAPFDPARPLGVALLDPTRIYVRAVLSAIAATGAVKALAHITGGGIGGNLARVIPEGFSARVDLSLIARQAVFGWLAQAGAIEDEEMLATFNCGAGMIAVAAEERARDVVSAFEGAGERATIVGRIERGGSVQDGLVQDGSVQDGSVHREKAGAAGAAPVILDGRPWWSA